MDRWVDAMHGVDDVPLRDPDRMRELRRSYYALVSYVDDKLGSLLTTLADCGLAEDTAVLFTSDHGDMLGERGMVQKRCFYEPSVRIPLIVTPPGGRAASVATGPTSILDVLPTILALAGVSEHLPLDGQSVLTGDGDTTSPERVVFSEYHSEGVYAPCFMARRGHHKLIYIHGHEHQLFDLAEDPGESRDLAGGGEFAVVEEELLEAILARFDPDQLETDIRAGLARRRVIKRAMARTRTHWDHTPYTDPTQQYWRFD